MPIEESQKVIQQPIQQQKIVYDYNRVSWNEQQILKERNAEYEHLDQNKFSEWESIAIAKPLYNGAYLSIPFNSYEMHVELKSSPGELNKIAHRYSSFEALHELLRLEKPGCFIPPIPPKNAALKGGVSNLENPDLIQRSNELNEFI